MPERTLIAKAMEHDSSKQATAIAVSCEPWPLDHRTEELGVSAEGSLFPPHPQASLPSLTKFCPRNPSVKGRDKEEPEGEPHREERRKERERRQ